MIEYYLATLVIGMGLGWFAKPAPSVIPPQPGAMTRCAALPTPAGPTLADVQKSAVTAAVAYREVCINHDELVDWSKRTVDKFE